jgi:excinuclease ABC subunit C
VYRFRDERGRVLYVGRAVNLRRRVRSYWGQLRGRRHLARMVPQVVGVEALECASEHEAAWVERNLLERKRPRWNRAIGGAEVPHLIRLDPRPRAPRLDAVHGVEEAPGVYHFGPYLGGLKVRLAVSALQRVFPLAYATDRGSGSVRDMGRVRGVDRDDLERLVSGIVAVLQRDTRAVEDARERLARRRDEAAAALAFELAGRLHEEVEALDWVVSDQRATLAEPRDFDVCGWFDGTLVEVRVLAGRLCVWTQRACDEPAARARVEATPDDWADFARRNAMLAATLGRA